MLGLVTGETSKSASMSVLGLRNHQTSPAKKSKTTIYYYVHTFFRQIKMLRNGFPLFVVVFLI